MTKKKDAEKQVAFIQELMKNQLTTPNDFTVGMGQLIKKARENKGLSQSELAVKLNRRQATVSDIENGKSETNILTLVQLAIVLDKPISYFFPDFLLKDHIVDVKTPFQYEMLELAKRIEFFVGDQKLVLDILEVLANSFQSDFENVIDQE